jgi:hypothetical protein
MDYEPLYYDRGTDPRRGAFVRGWARTKKTFLFHLRAACFARCSKEILILKSKQVLID